MSDAAIKRLTLELQKAEKRAATLAASLRDIAEHDCEYGDNCPSNEGTRHGTCIPCQARKGLQAAEINPLESALSCPWHPDGKHYCEPCGKSVGVTR